MKRSPKFIAIDLKSFYASVECVERGLNPLDTCLVVADKSRTDKTICLAVSPALKAYGIPGRPRLFEVIQRLREINRQRGRAGSSISGAELTDRPDLQIDYLVAQPRMRLYVDYSHRIYETYMRFVAPEDIHVYSIDEVFIDVTSYLTTYRCTAHQLALRIIRAVLAETGITATAGIGSNLYLSKIAMDIVAKKIPPDSDGVRIAELDEYAYRELLWDHRPLTDFWRIGHGIAARLEETGLYTMGNIARASLESEEWFFEEFGVNAELIIDHAWGYEPVTMEAIKKYRPTTHSLSSGQVLTEPYPAPKARVVAQEMADDLTLDLVEKNLVTDQILLTVGYDVENLSRAEIASKYTGRIRIDHYGRRVPYHAHGTVTLNDYTSSAMTIVEEITQLFDRIVNPNLLVRRLTIAVCRLRRRPGDQPFVKPLQLGLFDDYDELTRQHNEKIDAVHREFRRQKAVVELRKRFGKNSILKGLNYGDGATQRQRNGQIGGHKA